MSAPEDKKNSKLGKRNVLIAILVGQIGILTLIIVLAAVLGGIALDNRFGTKPWFTVGLLVASIPISLVVMIFIARKTVKNIRTNEQKEKGEEDAVGKNS